MIPSSTNSTTAPYRTSCKDRSVCSFVGSSGIGERRRKQLVEKQRNENTTHWNASNDNVIYSTTASGILYDHRRPPRRTANAVIHHQEGVSKEKQPPVDQQQYNCGGYWNERQQQEGIVSSSSLRRPRPSKDASLPSHSAYYNYNSLNKKVSTTARRLLSAMGQRFTRQQATAALPEVRISEDESKPTDNRGVHSLLVVSGVQKNTPSFIDEKKNIMNEYGTGCDWWNCPQTNDGTLSKPSNDYYPHQYLLAQQSYATLTNGRRCSASNKTVFMPTLQEKEQQMRSSAIGDRLANFREEYCGNYYRRMSPQRQIIDLSSSVHYANKKQKDWQAVLATPRLIRSMKVGQQTSSPLTGTPLLQKRIQQHKNDTSSYATIRHCPSVVYVPYNQTSPEYCPTVTTPLQSFYADTRPLVHNSPNDSPGLDPPPPTPEEAEDCLSAHLQVIYSDASLTRNRKQANVHDWHDVREYGYTAKTLGSSDVLLDSRHHPVQHSQAVDVMLSKRRSNSRPNSSVPAQGPSQFHQCYQQQHPHPSSALGQSQESLMSLMSTSSTSMVVPGGGGHHRLVHPHHQHASGSQSPSVLIRGHCRHSHHYGARHRPATASSCGSSSQASSDCGFGVISGGRDHHYRRSARNLSVRTPRRVVETNRNIAQIPTTIENVDLKPLPFEVPCVESQDEVTTIFVGRDWVFHELHEILVKTTSSEYGMKGAVVYGSVGTGKTAIIHQLASYSPFLITEDFTSGSPLMDIGNGSPCSDRVRVSVVNPGGGHGKNRASNSTDSGFVSGSRVSLNNRQAPPLPLRHAYQQAPPRPPLPDWHRSVCQSVVAFHFCQIEHQSTCLLPDFLRNLAAMFAYAPELIAYRELLSQQPKLQQLLTIDELLKDPVRSFRLAVTDPLIHLRKCGRTGPGNYLVLIDGLDEAEFHRPECGDSIGSFLVKHAMLLFPDWLKFVLTVKTAAVDLLKGLPLHKISLDDTVIDEWVFKDSKEYIRLRMSQSSTIQTNISGTKSPANDPTSSSPILSSSVSGNSETVTTCPLHRFAAHLASASKGNFLYMKLTLNLIEKNYLVMKGANYKVLPINLSEVFLLMFNLRFPTARSFERVAPLLNAVLASLKPLTSEQLYQAVCAGITNGYLLQEEFQERLKILEDYLVKKQDGTFVLFHPAFREWLTRRDDGQSPKYLCDLKYGHALLALWLSRCGRSLDADEMQELGHHLLKAHIYKRPLPIHREDLSDDTNSLAALLGRDCQLLWLNQAAADLRSSLCTQRNVCYPNSKVSRLLLLAGANSDAILPKFCVDEGYDQTNDLQTPTTDSPPNESSSGTPLLCSAAFYGQQEFANLLLEFGADVGIAETYKGRSPLMLAAAKGHLDMVQMLHQHGTKLSQIDNDHRCALVHAAENGHVIVVSFLLQCDWTEPTDNQDNGNAGAASTNYGYALRQQAAQQAFVAAASSGHTSMCEFLLDFGDVLVDEADPVSGETALSGACASARKETVGYLLNRAGARVAYGRQMEKPTPPLLQAVSNGCWEIVSTLLARQMDVDGERNGIGQTALMVAAQHGHVAVLELLLSRSVDVSAVDDDGRTALYWACLKDQAPATSLLLERGSNLQMFDNHGFGPIHYAAQHGSKQLIQLLLDGCPQLLETPTQSGSRLRPLDLAILADNTEAVQRFLKKGAKLAPSTWTFAGDKPAMIASLLGKLLEDGQLLYKRNRLEDAQHRFTYALKKIPPQATAGTTSAGWKEYSGEFERLRFHFQLYYARCLRKNGDAAKAAETCTEAIRNYQQAAMLSSSCRPLESEQPLVDAYICRARCYCELRQFEKAVEDLKRALLVSPTNRDAQQLLPKVKIALDSDGGGKAQKQPREKDELSSGSSLPSVSSPPHSSRESSALPTITDHETRADDDGHTPIAAASPSRSQASSDSGNMPDLDDGENTKGAQETKMRTKANLETQL